MRNLEHDPHVVVTAGPLGAYCWGTGKDIAVEGVAERWSTDHNAARKHWRRSGAPSTTATGSGRSATSGSSRSATRAPGGGDGAVVFRVPPSKVLVFGDEHGQTTYRF